MQKNRKKLVLALILVALGALAVAAGLFVYCIANIEWGTDIDETDFDTDAERIAFIQEVLTLPIPPNVTDIRLRYVAWMDWYLEASFTLPPDSIEPFRAELAKCKAEGPNRWSVEHVDKPTHWEAYELDPTTGIVTAEYVVP